MAQYIDKDKVIEYVKKRLVPTVNHGNIDDWERGADNERINFLSYINTLPEEKENYNERYKRIVQTEQFKKSYCDKSLGKEEPVSEDLEEEILCRWEDDPHTLWSKCPYSDFRNIARHFAEWQLNRMKEILRTEYEKGRFDMREEMMRDALDGCVTLIVKSDTSSRNLFISTQQLYKELQKYDDGDKVKIIIFKPEEQ